MDTEEERINEFKCKLIKSKLNLKQEMAKRGSVNLALLVKLAKTEEKNLTAVKKQGFPGGSAVKNLPANAGDVDSIPGLGTPLQKQMVSHSSILAWEIHGQRSLAGYSL